jgi:hypothetical protein
MSFIEGNVLLRVQGFESMSPVRDKDGKDNDGQGKEKQDGELTAKSLVVSSATTGEKDIVIIDASSVSQAAESSRMNGTAKKIEKDVSKKQNGFQKSSVKHRDTKTQCHGTPTKTQGHGTPTKTQGHGTPQKTQDHAPAKKRTDDSKAADDKSDINKGTRDLQARVSLFQTDVQQGDSQRTGPVKDSNVTSQKENIDNISTNTTGSVELVDIPLSIQDLRVIFSPKRKQQQIETSTAKSDPGEPNGLTKAADNSEDQLTEAISIQDLVSVFSPKEKQKGKKRRASVEQITALNGKQHGGSGGAYGSHTDLLHCLEDDDEEEEEGEPIDIQEMVTLFSSAGKKSRTYNACSGQIHRTSLPSWGAQGETRSKEKSEPNVEEGDVSIGSETLHALVSLFSQGRQTDDQAWGGKMGKYSSVKGTKVDTLEIDLPNTPTSPSSSTENEVIGLRDLVTAFSKIGKQMENNLRPSGVTGRTTSMKTFMAKTARPGLRGE